LLATTWAGALLGSHATLPVQAWVGGAAVAAVAAALAAVRLRVLAGRAHPGAAPAARRRHAPALLALLLGALLLVSTAAGAAVRTEAVQSGPLRRMADPPRVVQALLVVVGDVHDPPRGGRWVLARLVQVARPDAATVPSRERVLLRLPPGSDVAFGATYAVTGLAGVVEGAAAHYFATRGVVVDLRAVDVHLRAPPPAWQAATTWLRQRVADAAHGRLGPAQASLLTGLVTGDVRGQPDGVGEAVTASGLSHLVAVSGSNVAVVVAGVMAAALLSGLGRRAGWWMCLPVVWWFVVLVRLEPSVVRAAVMATLVLAAMLIGRVRSTPSLLCVTGLLALLIDPLLVLRPGFVLSMGATAGVLLLTPPFERRLHRHTFLPSSVRVVLAATCGAQLAVAPLLWVIGGTVHPASVPANLIAVPAASVASLIGGLVTVVATVAPEAAAGLALLAGPALAVVLWSATTFASPAGQQAAEVAVGVLGALIVVRAWPRLPVRLRLAAPAVGLVLGIVLVGPPTGGGDGAHPPAPVLMMLDVGQGDALLLGDPQAGWLLVDGGPDPDRLRAALQDHGVGSLVAVVASHPHADHTDGLVGVLQAMDVGALVLGPRGPEAAHLVAAAEGAGVPVLAVAAGHQWSHGGMQLSVLSPPPTGLGSEPNDNSLILRVDVSAGRSVLLTGDAEALAQGLLEGEERLDVDVLKVPHHGGDTNASGFLAATTPQQALISVGAGNTFGHPHPDVLAQLADLDGVPVLRTDVDGTVEVPLAD
ncbi:MAG TPA: ComEC/Rec2 family competence protein, partial [Euzebya sp.]|nr:ComEC/Rec2 family competence protein [Euzebya sp.]